MAPPVKGHSNSSNTSRLRIRRMHISWDCLLGGLDTAVPSRSDTGAGPGGVSSVEWKCAQPVRQTVGCLCDVRRRGPSPGSVGTSSG